MVVTGYLLQFKKEEGNIYHNLKSMVEEGKIQDWIGGCFEEE